LQAEYFEERNPAEIFVNQKLIEQTTEFAVENQDDRDVLLPEPGAGRFISGSRKRRYWLSIAMNTIECWSSTGDGEILSMCLPKGLCSDPKAD
jgi:hypothetical protein